MKGRVWLATSVWLLSICGSPNNFAYSHSWRLYNFSKSTEVPERIVVEKIQQPAIYSAGCYATYYSETVSSPDEPEFASDIAAGRYQKVIDEIQEEMVKLSPFWEKDSAAKLAHYQHMLAVAYELKGDWKNAIAAWVLVYGEDSDNCRWALIRILYAMGERDEVFELIRGMIEKVQWADVDNVKKKLEGDRFETRPLPPPMTPCRELDPEWLALVRFRDNCARIICPELHYVSSNLYKWEGGGAPDFLGLQQSSYARFVTFAKAYFDKNERPYLHKEHIEFLEKLRELPYQRVKLGM